MTSSKELYTSIKGPDSHTDTKTLPDQIGYIAFKLLNSDFPFYLLNIVELPVSQSLQTHDV